MDARQLRRVLALAAAALAVGGVAGWSIADGRPAPAASAAGTSNPGVGLRAARLAVHAQQLQSALAAYAVAAQTIRTPTDARVHSVQLRRSEEALAQVASLERGGASRAIQQRAQQLRATAVSLREAAQSESEGGDGVLRLVTFAGQVQNTSARLQSLLAVLAADEDPAAYSATLATIEREISRIDTGDGQGGGAAVQGDDPVPAP